MDNLILAELKEIKEELNKLKEHQLRKYFYELRENTDAWVRQINGDVSDLYELSSLVNENSSNIQHNYELIYEMKDQIEGLKQEINTLKLIQIISLKQKSQEREQTQTHGQPK